MKNSWSPQHGPSHTHTGPWILYITWSPTMMSISEAQHV